MKVLSVFQAPLRTAYQDETLVEASSRMMFFEVGALPVMDRGKMIGILTERDVVRAIGDEVDPDSTTVGEYMTTTAVSCSPEEDVAGALAKMVVLGTRHLPVVENNEPIGMISARDLLTVLGPQVARRRARAAG